MFKLYNDLIIEINAYKEQLEFANQTKARLEKLLDIRKPHDIKAMQTDTIGQASRDDTTLDRTFTRLEYTNKRIEAYTGILEGLEGQKKKMDNDFKKCEGLYYRVYDLNRIQKIPLEKVAEMLGYSHQYIKEVSAEISKNAI